MILKRLGLEEHQVFDVLLPLLWQSCAIGMACFLTWFAFPKLSVGWRSRIGNAGLMALGACLLVPLLTPQHQTPSLSTTEVIDTSEISLAAEEIPPLPLAQPLEPSSAPPSPMVQEASHPTTPPSTTSMFLPPAAQSDSYRPSILEGALLLWFLGFLVMLVRLVRSIGLGFRLCAKATLFHAPERDLVLTSLSSQIGLKSLPRIRRSDRISTPMVLGFFRPVILIPENMAERWALPQTQAVILHELGHIKRHDAWINLYQRCLEAIYFFHPVVWALSRQVSLERENCCDDLVIAQGISPLSYAQTLLTTAESLPPTSPPMIKIAAAGSGGSELRQRIMRLLGERPPLKKKILGTTLALLVVSVGLSRSLETSITQDYPEGLVAVLGDDRARVWGHAHRLELTPNQEEFVLTEALGYVSVFATETLQRVHRFRPHQERCLHAKLLLGGSRLVTASMDGTVALFDFTVRPPQELDRFRLDEKDAWLRLSVATSMPRVAVSSQNGLALLEIQDDRLVEFATLPQDELGSVWQIALSPQGTRLATFGNPLILWDLENEVPKRLHQRSVGQIQALQFSSSGAYLFYANDQTVEKPNLIMLDVSEDALAEETKIEANVSVFSSHIVLDREDTRLTFVGLDQLKVFEKVGDDWAQIYALDKPEAGAFARLGEDALLVINDPLIQKWELINDEYELAASVSGHQSLVIGLAFDPQKNALLSAGHDGVREWPLEDRERPGDSQILVGDFAGSISLWDWGQRGFLLNRVIDEDNTIQGVRRGRNLTLSRFRINFGPDYTKRPWSATMHPELPILATGHWDSSLKLWRIEGRHPQLIKEWKVGEGHLCDVRFSPDGKQLVTANWRKKVVLFTLDSFDDEGAPIREDLGEHFDIVREVAWSPDGRYVCSGGQDGQILLWDRAEKGPPLSLTQPSDGAPKASLSNPTTIGSLQFDQSSRRLLSADSKGRVTLWDTEQGGSLKTWQMPGWVWDAKFSPDESMIATANDDGTIYLLETPE